MDLIPGVFVFEKDRESRFQAANRALWNLHGCRSESEMLGRTDYDFHAPELARQYIEEDRWVMERGERVIDRLWLVPGAHGHPQWYWSSKIPLRDSSGRVTGLAGVLRPHDEAGAAPGMLQRLTPAIRKVLRDYGEGLRVGELAGLCGLSTSQFQREFKRLLGMTPSAYLTWVRIQAARQRLSEGDSLLAEIALECGFCDQSHFVKRFRAETGMRPLDYRRKFGR
ncbi:AraC-type DNA-binding domain-containing protein [Haloferula helveola]|uniref:AraC-type DNA-binding domain-containing protein n=2 Tax=Haloferula helveola TaxID=490095 RepID=A0ABN6GY48_9BACT|nr:AraC-type DNA-binding domain-containing protein [Haloferula helveola]